MNQNLDPETRLQRKALAKALTDNGFPTSASALATRATRGDGPPFQRYGRYSLYRLGDALDWARSRLSRRVTSTAELPRSNAPPAADRAPAAEQDLCAGAHPEA
jgi:hypothetical protein